MNTSPPPVVREGLPLDPRSGRRSISSACSRSARADEGATARLGAQRAPTAHALAGRHVALLFEKPSLRTRVDLRDRRPRARRRHAARAVASSPKARASRSKTSPATSSAGSHALVVRTFAQEKAAHRWRGRAAAARHQRADRRRASVPGAGRHADAARALGDAARPDHRLRRRRQQRRDLAGACRVHAGHPRARRLAARLRAARRRSSPRPREVAQDGARRSPVHRSARGGRAAPTPIYTDVWTSMGEEREAAERQADLRAVPGQRGADGRRRAERAVHALPARASRRGSHRGGARVAASVVFDQAENRLHTQKALLLMLLGADGSAWLAH